MAQDNLRMDRQMIGKYRVYAGVRSRVLTDYWTIARATGAYKGKFPDGLMPRVIDFFDSYLGLKWNNLKRLYQFGGKVNDGDTVDLNPECKPTFLTDAVKMEGVPKQKYDVVFADPGYSDFDYEKWGAKPIKPYSFIAAGLECVKLGGYYILLHTLMYKMRAFKGSRAIAYIAIDSGPNHRIRGLQIYQKVN
jgi:hypothetical protein